MTIPEREYEKPCQSFGVITIGVERDALCEWNDK
jgi:hypothetical protein